MEKEYLLTGSATNLRYRLRGSREIGSDGAEIGFSSPPPFEGDGRLTVLYAPDLFNFRFFRTRGTVGRHSGSTGKPEDLKNTQRYTYGEIYG